MNDIYDFQAAIFDLDGTILDSLGVWAHVDEVFFARRGIPLPEDYGRALSGMSYLEAARYTRERFAIAETAEEIWAEWSRIAAEDYACRVELKAGAAAYLRALKRAGIKLAVATVLPEHLYAPCLKRHGLYGLFDAFCSTHETSGKNKLDGEVFRQASACLGVEPAFCLAFDDVLEGIVGAKSAGMRALCVHEPASAHAEPSRAADGFIADWADAPMPKGLRRTPARCVIFTAYCKGDVRLAYEPRPGDFLLAADGGYRIALNAGLHCDELIGDFDSMPAPDDAALAVAHYPVEKDDTDTILCVNRALALGYDDILLIGGVGGRVDHTLANVQTLSYALARHAHIELNDGRVWMTALNRGEIKIPRRLGKLSVFALSERVTGVTLDGLHYPLQDATLTNDYPLGVSNAFEDDTAVVRVRDGALLVVVGATD